VLKQLVRLRKQKNTGAGQRVCLVVAYDDHVTPCVKEEPTSMLAVKHEEITPCSNQPAKQFVSAKLAGFLDVDNYMLEAEKTGPKGIQQRVCLNLSSTQPYMAWEAMTFSKHVPVTINKHGQHYPKWFPEIVDGDQASLCAILNVIDNVRAPSFKLCGMIVDELQEAIREQMEESVSCAPICSQRKLL
jgi:hypothetical protein